MKKLFIGIAALALTAFSMTASAYPGHGDEDRQGRRAQMMEKMLDKAGVSEAQKAQIKSIRENYKPQLQSIRESGKSLRSQKQNLDPASASFVSQVQALHAQGAELRKQAVTIKAQMKHEIALVLTPEQRAELKEMREEFKAKRSERSKKRRKRMRN